MIWLLGIGSDNVLGLGAGSSGSLDTIVLQQEVELDLEGALLSGFCGHPSK